MIKLRTFEDWAMLAALIALLLVVHQGLALFFVWLLICVWAQVPNQNMTLSELFYALFYTFNLGFNRRSPRPEAYKGPERRMFRISQ